MGVMVFAVKYERIKNGSMSHEAGNYLADALGVNDEAVVYFINDETAPAIEENLTEDVASGKISTETATEVREFLTGIKGILEKDGAIDLSIGW